MKYTCEEVMQYVLEEDVKFIRLAFCDVYGKLKNVAITPDELRAAFKYGVAIDGSAIDGFDIHVRSDLFLIPDPDTLAVLPWRPEHGRVVRMYCTVCYPDGTPFSNDTRSVLIKAIADAEKEGVRFDIGPELEFYLFKVNENGDPTRIPHDNASYMDLAPDDRGENVRRQVCLTLEQMGIHPESSHHEEGPGQNEIDIRYSDALSAADNAVTLHTVVKTIADRNGLSADFSPKPLEGKPGSGFHINISLSDPDLLPYATAGILNRIPEMTLFLNPTFESYQRLGKGKAPSYVSWSHENRSQLIRIPATRNGKVRIELRSPDSAANPYLAFALIIYAGLEGIRNKSELPSPVDLNLFAPDTNIPSGLCKLPLSKNDAVRIAKNSTFIAEHIPASLLEAYRK